MMSLKGKICLVTGATRGIGHGIAVQLGEAGATVYITGNKTFNVFIYIYIKYLYKYVYIYILHIGRTLTAPAGDNSVGGCLTDTAKEVITIQFSCTVQ